MGWKGKNPVGKESLKAAEYSNSSSHFEAGRPGVCSLNRHKLGSEQEGVFPGSWTDSGGGMRQPSGEERQGSPFDRQGLISGVRRPASTSVS